MEFSQVEAEFKRLKGQFEAGALTEADFKARLQDLMIQDEQGRWWMIGYETGQWYVHDGEKWVQSEPPPVKASESQVPVQPVATPTAPVGRWWVWAVAGVIGLILLLVLVRSCIVPGPGAQLWAGLNVIRPGECTLIHWNVPGAQGVRLVGPGFDPEIVMPGSGQRDVCPPETAKYQLQSPDRRLLATFIIEVRQ